MTEEMHRVRGSRRQRGYWRKKPYTYRHPSQAQRKARAILARTAFEKGRGTFGKAEIVDKEGQVKEVPASAVPIQEEMTGLKIKVPEVPRGAIPVPALDNIDRLKRVLEILAAATERRVLG